MNATAKIMWTCQTAAMAGQDTEIFHASTNLPCTTTTQSISPARWSLHSSPELPHRYSTLMGGCICIIVQQTHLCRFCFKGQPLPPHQYTFKTAIKTLLLSESSSLSPDGSSSYPIMNHRLQMTSADAPQATRKKYKTDQL